MRPFYKIKISIKYLYLKKLLLIKFIHNDLKCHIMKKISQLTSARIKVTSNGDKQTLGTKKH